MRMTPRRHQKPAKPHASWWRQRIPFVVILLVLAASAWSFIAYAEGQQRTAAAHTLTTQREFAARIDAQVKATLQKRIDDARKAEEEAKANAEAEAKARAALTQPIVPLSQTANPTNCGVAQPDSLQVIINKKPAEFPCIKESLIYSEDTHIIALFSSGLSATILSITNARNDNFKVGTVLTLLPSEAETFELFEGVLQLSN